MSSAVRKLYLRDGTTTVTGTLPGGTTLSAVLTATQSATGASTNRTMVGFSGPSQVSATVTTAAVTTSQNSWYRRFVSLPLDTQTIAAGTWALHIGATEGNAASNMFMLIGVLAVWRPGTGALVGRIFDASTQIGLEPGTSETALSANITGVSLAVQAGDVLVLELWSSNVQSMATGYTNTVSYDGISEDSTTSNAAYLLSGSNILILEQAVANTLEGGTNGTTITTANSGGSSGDAFDVALGANVFSTAAKMHGSVSMALTPPSISGGLNGITWWTAMKPATNNAFTEGYARGYFNLGSLPDPGAEYRLIRFWRGGSASTANKITAMGVYINNSGNLLVRDNADTLMTTTTEVMPTGQWFRLEAHSLIAAVGPSAQDIRFNTASPDSASYVEYLSSAGGTSGFNGVDFGVEIDGSHTYPGSVTFFLDDLKVTPGALATGWIGSSVLATSLLLDERRVRRNSLLRR